MASTLHVISMPPLTYFRNASSILANFRRRHRNILIPLHARLYFSQDWSGWLTRSLSLILTLLHMLCTLYTRCNFLWHTRLSFPGHFTYGAHFKNISPIFLLKNGIQQKLPSIYRALDYHVTPSVILLIAFAAVRESFDKRRLMLSWFIFGPYAIYNIEAYLPVFIIATLISG